MSRRRRNSSNKNDKPQKKSSSLLKGLWWKLLLLILIVVVVGGIIAYKKVIAFLHSDSFRADVSEQVSAELGTVGELGEFTWSGLNGKNKSFKASGDGLIGLVDVEDISFDVELDYIKRDKFKIKNISVGSVYSEVDIRKSFNRLELPKKEKGFLASLLPEEIEIVDASLHDLNAKLLTDTGVYEVNGLGVEAIKKDDAYEVVLDGGRLKLPFPFLKSATLVGGELVQLDNEIYITDTKLEIFKSGEVTLNGEVDLSPRARQLYNIDGVLSGLECADVFPKNWQQHIIGKVQGEFKIQPGSNAELEPIIAGKGAILNGQLRALPILDTMAKYFSKDYQTVNFQKLECEFKKDRDRYSLRNMLLVSEGLIQVEGGLEIDGVNLDGSFNVGVPGKHLNKLPGAKGNVFKRGKDGLYWANIKIGGTFDNITNDIKDRLINAAVDAAFGDLLKLGGVISPEATEQAKKLLKEGFESGQSLEDLQKLFSADKGLLDFLPGKEGLLENGLDATKGLLNGITGGGKSPNDNSEETEEPEKPGLPGIPDLPIPEIPNIPLPF